MFTNEPLPTLQFDKKRSNAKLCPCGKNNKDGKFVPYKGFENKGYCHSCGETFLPELQKSDTRNSFQPTHHPRSQQKPPPPIDFLPMQKYQQQLINGTRLYTQNHFIQWLGSPHRGIAAFDNPVIQALIEKYYLANSGKAKYSGWTLFPYINIEGKLRDIKAMDYNPATGKRIKEPYNKIVFMGKEILNNPHANTVRCFYGEHLLKDNLMPVKIFESEATATYAAPFYPTSICLATGGSNGCKWTEKEKCAVLKGRPITLYPDIDAHESWAQKASILKGYGLHVQVSDLIKDHAIKFAEQTGSTYEALVEQKFDLRDILQFKDLNSFYTPTSPSIPIIQDPFISMIEIDTGSQFNNMILALIKTQSNKEYNLLFDNNGLPIVDQTEAVKKLAKGHNLLFQVAIIDNEKYLAAMPIS